MTAVLRLSLMTPLGDSPDQQKRMLTSGSLKIGRDETNDWSLDDNSRRISRHHCTITANGGLFIIIDSSANGLFINDAKQPLGRGNSAILSNGDVLRIGNLAISVEVAEQLVTDSDPFRAVLPKLGSPSVPKPETTEDALDRPLSASVLSSMSSAPPPDWASFGLRPLPDLGRPDDAVQRPVTMEDHLPAEQEAILAPRVISQAIPEDWDLDLAAGARPAMPGPFSAPGGVPPVSAVPLRPAPDLAASAFPPPGLYPRAMPDVVAPERTAPESAGPGSAVPQVSPPPAPSAAALALVEALARIEAEVIGPFEAPLLAGPPEQVLARLESEEGDWIGLTLAALAARIISRLNRPETITSQSGATAPQDHEPPRPNIAPIPYIPEGDL